jgi:hypothetical protein
MNILRTSWEHLENLMGTHWETDPKTKDFPPHLGPQNPKERTKPPESSHRLHEISIFNLG